MEGIWWWRISFFLWDYRNFLELRREINWSFRGYGKKLNVVIVVNELVYEYFYVGNVVER